jgi:hypothetical protein
MNKETAARHTAPHLELVTGLIRIAVSSKKKWPTGPISLGKDGQGLLALRFQ